MSKVGCFFKLVAAVSLMVLAIFAIIIYIKSYYLKQLQQSVMQQCQPRTSKSQLYMVSKVYGKKKKLFRQKTNEGLCNNSAGKTRQSVEER